MNPIESGNLADESTRREQPPVMRPETYSIAHQQDRDVDTLEELGCPSEIAERIVNAIRYRDSATGRYVYIAGPMRGHDQFNFPAFDATRDVFVARGWNVISPADLDREDPQTLEHLHVRRDFWAIYFVAICGEGAIAMLPGWEQSIGATAEFFLARWLGLRILDANTGEPLCGYSDFVLDNSIHAYLKKQEGGE